jgi:hypothetical protein
LTLQTNDVAPTAAAMPGSGGPNLAVAMSIAGAEREVVTCGQHVVETAHRGRILQVLDEGTHADCHACRRDQQAKAARERNMTMKLAHVGVTRFGRAGEFGSYDGGWSVWFVFGRRLSEATALRRLAEAGVYLEARRCGHSFDCCACTFSDGPWIVRRGSRTLVRQSWAKNV